MDTETRVSYNSWSSNLAGGWRSGQQEDQSRAWSSASLSVQRGQPVCVLLPGWDAESLLCKPVCGALLWWSQHTDKPVHVYMHTHLTITQAHTSIPNITQAHTCSHTHITRHTHAHTHTTSHRHTHALTHTPSYRYIHAHSPSIIQAHRCTLTQQHTGTHMLSHTHLTDTLI